MTDKELMTVLDALVIDMQEQGRRTEGAIVDMALRRIRAQANTISHYRFRGAAEAEAQD